MKRWCRVYVCLREAEPGSEFCAVHGWNQPKLPAGLIDIEPETEETE